ncbi:SGNH/GDSL hydrolase family protein [Gordonia desulfuricans]|uniref:SGNH/GDSL hydrolase family protein n=1 Tax=Gordonia desulfuricans TaxID=89051 RepID=A0A7K3LLC3_9ACTN|nr:SGNH/GDSL hydrolase family protein [Gordonia desulfuricans]NDK88963.1 SGNH/GDSL hydrolase family protein [Gordonia desulfuricans]
MTTDVACLTGSIRSEVSVKFNRYVALGDSFTEGVGDADPARPNGLRGWADRVAEELGRHSASFEYANLAIRGKLLDQVIEEQIDTAVALRPDLVTIYAGGNDMMRPSIDIDGLVARYEQALSRLVDTGATVVVFTAYDAGWAPVFRLTRGRAAVYNELVREVADRLGVTVLDFWRLRGYDDYRMWDTDRLHMSSPGHARMASEVLDRLGVQHTIALDPLPAATEPTPDERRRDDLRWARTFLGPWLMRRVRGTSSGDGVTPRWPIPVPAADALS